MNFIVQNEKTRNGTVALIEISTGKENTFTAKSLGELSEILSVISGDDNISGILFHSTNDRFFSNGLDIPNMYQTPDESLENELFALTGFFQNLLLFPKPAVAEISGHAMGAGAVLAIGCDNRYMLAKGCRIGFPEVHLGLPMPQSFVSRLRHIVHPADVTRLCLEGKAYKGEQALSSGIVDSIFENNEDLRKGSLNKLNELFKIPLQSFKLAKYGLNISITEAYGKQEEDMKAIVCRNDFKSRLKDNLRNILKT